MYSSVSLEQLVPGTVLSAPIYDPHEGKKKLLGAGLRLTEQLIARLRDRGVRRVALSARDRLCTETLRPRGTARTCLPDRRGITCQLETDITRELDRQIHNDAFDLIKNTEPFNNRVLAHPPFRYEIRQKNHVLEQYRLALKRMEQLNANLLLRSNAEIAAAKASCDEILETLADDKDLFICLAINPLPGSYPVSHGLHVAMVAMAMGAALGCDRPALVELGLGCLLHDCGMLRVSKATLSVTEELDTHSFGEIVQHPMRTFELLEPHLDRISLISRMVAYQTHERCDGSGYPRGTLAAQIHPLAKVAAVADAFVALVSPRPYRAGMMPYYAMEKILSGVQTGLFDAYAVRGLLTCVSLFPIGSFVETSDGRVGKVLRTVVDCYDRPVVELWSNKAFDSASKIVDLSVEPELRVVRPIPQLT